MPQVADFVKFKLLLWKSCYVLLHSPVHLIFSILSPSLFCFVLIVLRFSLPVSNIPVQKHSPIRLEKYWADLIDLLSRRIETMHKLKANFTHNIYVPQLIVGYAPNTYKAFREIMEKNRLDFKRVDLYGYESCAELRQNMATEHFIAGVCFDSTMFEINVTETLHFHNDYPNRLNYTLIYPSELRIYHETFISSSWSTNILHYPFEQQKWQAHRGGYVGYCREGFIPLQYAISEAYSKLVSEREDLPKVVLRPFPHPEYNDDSIISRLEMLLMLIVLSGYVYPLSQLIKQAVIERESQLRDILQTMGISYKLYFAAFYVTGIMLISISSVLMITILKIHWYSGHAILSRSSWCSLLILITFFNSASICFAFMISSIFSFPSTAVAIGGILWFASYLPYMLSLNVENFFFPTWYMCLFSNSVMALVFKNILHFEAYSEGLKLSYFVEDDVISTKLSIGMFLLILLVQSIAYVVIGLFMDYIDINSFEILTTLKEIFYKCTGNRFISRTRRGTFRLSSVHEIEPLYKNATIEIYNVTKMYAGKAAIKNISMKLYEDDITVLLGHNGSGKTTLLALIAGIVKPSNGRVVIRDLHLTAEETRYGLGVSLDENALFNDLTVENQLIFFCNIRGTEPERHNEEVLKYLTAMNLIDKRYILTRNLTEGQRQQLAACCALIGDSKIVILDDPTSKMDMQGKKSLCDLLIKEKLGRTIIVSTHSTDEAAALASNTTILSNGGVKYHGSNSLLKSVYSAGFQLTCIKGQYCDVDDVTALFEKHIPRITPMCNIGREFAYMFEAKYGGIIADILDDFEAKCDDLHIEGYSFRQLSMDDIFFQLGAEDPSYGEPHRQREIWNGVPIYTDEYRRLSFPDAQSSKFLNGTKLWATHWRAMLLKHAAYNKSYVVLNFLLIAIPVLCVTLSFMMTDNNVKLKQLETISFSLTDYQNTITVIDQKHTTNAFIKEIASKFTEMFFWLGNMEHRVEDTDGEIVEVYLLEKKRHMLRRINYQYIIAVSFANDHITAWFNNHAIHTAPLSLNSVQNAILRVLLDDNAKITVNHEPLPFVNTRRLTMMESTHNVGNLLAIGLSFLISFFYTYPVVFLVKENHSRFKLLQFISGARFTIFWMSKFMWDLGRGAMISVAISITIVAFQNPNFDDSDIITAYTLVLFFSAACLLSMSYVLSLFFSDPVFAYSAISAIYLYGASGFCTSYYLLTQYYGPFYLKDDHPIEWFLRIFPTFSIGNALVKIYYISEMSEVCMNDDVYQISTILEDCKVEPNCCHTRHILEIKSGIKADMLYIIGITIINWVVLYMLECRVIWRSENFFGDIPDDTEESAREDHERRHADEPDGKIDESALREQVKVLTLRPSEYYEKALICDHIGKIYKGKKAIDRLHLVVERYIEKLTANSGMNPKPSAECIGIVGDNGCGKSVFLKILVGDEKMSYGRIFVDSINLKNNLHKMYTQIGYCPENNHLMNEYTASEIMKYMCLLRGVPKNDVHAKCKGAAKVLGFYSDYKKKLSIVSKGNKKRLGCALALLNEPSIIYMDEPTTNIDPAGRRQIWNMVLRLRRRNATVIIASKRKFECERYCQRLAIFSEGRLTNIGNIIELSDKFPQGHLLYLKLKDSVRRRSTLTPMAFIETEFPKSVLKDSYGDMLVFFLPLKSTKLSSLFNELQRNAFNLNIDYFVITRDRLTNVF